MKESECECENSSKNSDNDEEDYIYVKKSVVTAELERMTPQTIENTRNLILLPWYTYAKSFSAEDSHRAPNYTEYQLFCFLTKYSRALKWFKTDFMNNYYRGKALFPKGNNLYPTPNNIIIPVDESRGIEGGTQVHIDIYDDSQHNDSDIINPISFSNEDLYYFQELADQILKEDEELSEYCIIFNINELEYDSNWIYYMLKNIEIVYPNLYKNGNLYVKITDNDFKPIYDSITEEVKSKLDAFNASSAIYLDPILDQDFIRNWELEQLIGNIYKPNWIDDRFADNRYEFLRNQLLGEPIYVSYEINHESLKHLTYTLKNYTWFITRDKVGIYVNGYFDAIKVVDDIFGDFKKSKRKDVVRSFVLGWPETITV